MDGEVPHPDLSLNLLDRGTYRELTHRPERLRERLLSLSPKPEKNEKTLVVVDEIQKIPALLDEVQRLIDGGKYRFLLTGSSARKLRRGRANLLAGRAWRAFFFPLIAREITDFNLLKYLSLGGLPQVYTSADPRKELQNYIDLYMKEEIQEEGLVRKLDQFFSFFDTVGLMSGEELNFQGWSNDTDIPRKTLESYKRLLLDTLLAFELEPLKRTKKRKVSNRSKFYLFDVGVAGFLSKRGKVHTRSREFGRAFEHFIIQECRACNAYREKGWDMCYWRTHSKLEVDLCLGNEWAIEIKGRDVISPAHLKGLQTLREEGLFEKYAVICLEEHKRIMGEIEIWPWESFLSHLWG